MNDPMNIPRNTQCAFLAYKPRFFLLVLDFYVLDYHTEPIFKIKWVIKRSKIIFVLWYWSNKKHMVDQLSLFSSVRLCGCQTPVLLTLPICGKYSWIFHKRLRGSDGFAIIRHRFSSPPLMSPLKTSDVLFMSETSRKDQHYGIWSHLWHLSTFSAFD